jgi:molecular chaperone DnaJ
VAKRDYYEVLGVSQDASDADIKKSFRRLARELHPDVNPDPAAGEAFREAAEAYEVLSDADTRSRYDRFGHAGVSQSQLHTEQFMDFSSLTDLLGAFFGDDMFGGMSGGGRRRGSDAQVETRISLADAVTGVTQTLDVDLVAACDVCDGVGAEPGTSVTTCPTCGGAGRVQHVAQTAFGQFVQTAACAACGGRGQKIEHPCTTCRGRGVRKVTSHIEVQIPAGIADGQRMRLNDRGHVDEAGVTPGDLYVHVGVAPDPRFERDGNDLVSVLEVPFSQAALGATVTVETIDGPEPVEIRPGVQANEILMLKGKGIPVLGGRGRGDHRVVVNVLVPRHLNEQQRELLKQFESTVDETTYASDNGFFGRLRAAFR